MTTRVIRKAYCIEQHILVGEILRYYATPIVELCVNVVENVTTAACLYGEMLTFEL